LTVSKANQNANLVYAGPVSGSAAAPTFRALVVDDLPSLGITALFWVSILPGMLPTAMVTLSGGVISSVDNEAAADSFESYTVGTAGTMDGGSGWDGNGVIVQY
jgi:hypothetical protein